MYVFRHYDGCMQPIPAPVVVQAMLEHEVPSSAAKGIARKLAERDEHYPSGFLIVGKLATIVILPLENQRPCHRMEMYVFSIRFDPALCRSL